MYSLLSRNDPHGSHATFPIVMRLDRAVVDDPLPPSARPAGRMIVRFKRPSSSVRSELDSATRGECLIGRVPQGHWKTITFVGALRRNGMRTVHC
jgi:hypothetical protein